ncbi:hypothetical protein ACFV3E_36650 [Streptomyces sp. NPDC059718]
MNPEHHRPTDQVINRPVPAVPTAIWPSQSTAMVAAEHPDVTIYQVPVPGAVQVQLPDGRIAWGRPTEHHLTPIPVDTTPREPMPAWAKAIGMVAGSLTALSLGGAIALRIAEPALGDLVDVLAMLFRVGLVLAVLLFGSVFAARRMSAKSTGSPRRDREVEVRQTIIIAPTVDSGGTRLFGRAGDVNVQVGDRNRNNQ